MVECPHCNENGIKFWAKLWSDSACPVKCHLCGNLSYLSSKFTYWADGSLQYLGLVAIVVSLFLFHWWPIIIFVVITGATYILIGLYGAMVPVSNSQAIKNKRYGNLFLLFIILLAVVIGFITK